MSQPVELSASLNFLRAWFLQFQRPLPWRESPTPYRVWISEVMLQQTRAEVVIPYYHRWLAQFPDVQSLAKAPLEKVVKAWEGLGYYSRARNLHSAAGQIEGKLSGEFPKSEEQLRKLKGIGPYTAAAVAAFALHLRSAPIDGNVMRVLTRWLALSLDISDARVPGILQTKLLSLLPRERPWEVAEGLIELGATICTKKRPKCAQCPLRSTCLARASNQVDLFPVRRARPPSQHLFRLALLIHRGAEAQNHFLVRKSVGRGVMLDLWEFPYLEVSLNEKALILSAQENWERVRVKGQKLLESLGLRASLSTLTPVARHTFTRYKVAIAGLCGTCSTSASVPLDPLWEYRFLNRAQLAELPFSSGHRQLLSHLVDRA